MKLKCPKCGKQLSEGSFCPDCGTKLVNDGPARCPKCGKEGAGAYCQYCGTAMNSGAAQGGGKKKKGMVPMIAIAAVILVLGLAGLGGDDDGKSSTSKSSYSSSSSSKSGSSSSSVTSKTTTPAETKPSESTIYQNAVNAYYNRRYSEARSLFSSVSSYADSSKYLRLIRIRNAGSNIGVGSAVYQSACGLTESDKDDIDAAARDFYFADTAEVLLCNSDVACYYLVGEWNGGSKCYIHFKMNNYGGTYNIGSKLSTNYQSTFSINDGKLRVDVPGSNTLVLTLQLTGPDCMNVHTHEKNNDYVLTRS